jgi:hypothetical protein
MEGFLYGFFSGILCFALGLYTVASKKNLLLMLKSKDLNVLKNANFWHIKYGDKDIIIPYSHKCHTKDIFIEWKSGQIMEIKHPNGLPFNFTADDIGAKSIVVRDYITDDEVVFKGNSIVRLNE